MAKLTCKLVHIYGLEKEKRGVLERLQELSVMDIETVSEDELLGQSPEGYQKTDTQSQTTAYERQLSDAEEALKIIGRRFPEKKGLLASFEGPPLIRREDFYLDRNAIQTAVTEIHDVLEWERTIAEQKAEIIRLKTTAEQMAPYASLDVPLSFSGTARTTAFIGSVAGNYTLEDLLTALAEQDPTVDFYGEIVSTNSDTSFVFLCCPVAQREQAAEALRTLSFARPVQNTSKLPADKIASKMRRVTEAEQKI